MATNEMLTETSEGKHSDEEQGLAEEGPPEVDTGIEVQEGAQGPDVNATRTTLDLYSELFGPIMAAYLMFILPDIREMIRKNLLEGDQDLLDRCINEEAGHTTAKDFFDVYNQNLSKIEEYISCQERSDMYLSTFQNLMKDPENIRILRIDDSNQEEECVYALTVNHEIKRVGVTFRGSVTSRDFGQDAKAVLSNIPNPTSTSNQIPTLGIHLGFREYLYGEKPLFSGLFLPLSRSSKNKDTGDKENGKEKEKVKIELMVDEVMEIFKEHPDYSLYVQGHSLGGALATLFAFEAAAHPDIPKPVTCVTSGSPKVGNLDFGWAFEQLEVERKLRCIRVVNYRDPVSLSPPPGFIGFLLPKRRFRHVGFRIRLAPHVLILAYPPKVRSCCGILLCDTFKTFRNILCLALCLFPFLFFFVLLPAAVILAPLVCCIWYTWHNKKFFRAEHTQLKYSERLLQHKAALTKLTLDDLYEERFAAARWRLPYIRLDAEDTRRKWCCSRVG